MKQYSTVVAIKLVGYLNFETKKVYKTKAGLLASQVKCAAIAKAKAAKKFVNDVAAILRGQALRTKLWAAKRMLKLKGWSFARYCEVLTAYRLIGLFNKGVVSCLRVWF